MSTSITQYFPLPKRAFSLFLHFSLLLFSFLFLTVLTSQHPLIQQAAAATDLYVSTTGSDSYSCTNIQPCASINHAASLATPGTTVHVASGTYTQAVTTNVSGTTTDPITFLSDTKWGAKIQLSSGDAPLGIWNNTGSYVTIAGFDISGGSGYNGIIYTGFYVTISGNRVHDLGSSSCSSGAGINDNAHYSPVDTANDSIIGNVVFNIGPTSTCSSIHGIYSSTNNVFIATNIISNVAGYGIQCWHACSANTIVNNTVFNNLYGGIVFGGGDSPNYSSSNCDYMVVSNNIAVNNTYYGIREYEYGGEHTIGSHNQILNNNVYGNPTSNMALIEGNTDSGRVTSNANFVNYQADGSGDYHLQATSPDIDTGTSTGAPSTDFDGNARPLGSSYDIGAYEYPPEGMGAPETLWPLSPLFLAVPQAIALLKNRQQRRRLGRLIRQGRFTAVLHLLYAPYIALLTSVWRFCLKEVA